MTRRSPAQARHATVYGERITELLPALGSIISDAHVLPAGGESGQGHGTLSLSLTLPPDAGGSVRRAVLRSQAEMLRREADAVGTRAPARPCQHCHESAALLAVVGRLQRVARALRVTGTTAAERALLLGQLSPSCRCRAAS